MQEVYLCASGALFWACVDEKRDTKLRWSTTVWLVELFFTCFKHVSHSTPALLHDSFDKLRAAPVCCLFPVCLSGATYIKWPEAGKGGRTEDEHQSFQHVSSEVSLSSFLTQLFAVQQAVDCKMELDVEEYVAGFRPELMEFAADWSLGARFLDIQQRSDYFEVGAHATCSHCLHTLQENSTASPSRHL